PDGTRSESFMMWVRCGTAPVKSGRRGIVARYAPSPTRGEESASGDMTPVPNRRPLLIRSVADAWLGFLWAGLLGEFVAAVYFDSLVALAPRPSALLLALLLAPALLSIPRIRALAYPACALGAVALLAAPAAHSLLRSSLLGAGLAGVSLSLFAAA